MPTTYQLVLDIKKIVEEIKCLLEDMDVTEDDVSSLSESDTDIDDEEEPPLKKSTTLSNDTQKDEQNS